MTPKYKRVLIKLSGEALAGKQGHGLDESVISVVVEQIKTVHDLGVEVALVIGGGNFWRGRQGKQMDRTTADHMGMLATVMNSLAMMDALEQRGIPTRVQTALIMTSVAEPYFLRKGQPLLLDGHCGGATRLRNSGGRTDDGKKHRRYLRQRP